MNQLVNVFWTIISFLAVGFYWGRYFAEGKSTTLLYVFIIASLLFIMLPRKWLAAFEVSKKRETYERLGVTFLLWFVQNGKFVKRMQTQSGKRKTVISNRKNAVAYLTTINMQERFHYCCLVFFALSAISAFQDGEVKLALLILLSNIFYNVYPILLQQYNRLRIRSIIPNFNKATHSAPSGSGSIS